MTLVRLEPKQTHSKGTAIIARDADGTFTVKFSEAMDTVLAGIGSRPAYHIDLDQGDTPHIIITNPIHVHGEHRFQVVPVPDTKQVAIHQVPLPDGTPEGRVECALLYPSKERDTYALKIDLRQQAAAA